MNEVERLCDRVIIMKRGRIEDDDAPEKLLARYGRRTLEEVFLDVARGQGIHEGTQEGIGVREGLSEGMQEGIPGEAAQ